MSVGEIVAFVVLGVPIISCVLWMVVNILAEIAIIIKDTIDYWRR